VERTSDGDATATDTAALVRVEWRREGRVHRTLTLAAVGS
jgi:hypothetical protein